ncbi:hypothetical protein BD410DRAFT_820772 [Rickenella mellea]|uniref:Transmembrane protein 19 n=1 Tax=Rickenella mellea TaxID=50990 RepID=A0A4Y7Q993_9AGAM|nr:hypothetical protein BD410DRAFT_820772 [Rickenella mellea]
MVNSSEFPWIPLALATALAGHGHRKKSLSSSGSVAAFVIGFIMMSARLRAFGVSLIVFYLIGSRATKMGKNLKEFLEEGHQEAGYRSAWQVLCNSFTAFVATLLWIAMFTNNSVISSIIPHVLIPKVAPFTPETWCPIALNYGDGWSRYLLYLTLGHFSCCLGDTLASELGILSRTPPILITTFQRVPPGTNGGMSVLGTLSSVLGGVLMGVTMSVSLLVQNQVCRSNWPSLTLELILWGALGGGFGSLIDSFMGATIQRTRYSTTTKRILQDDTVVTDDVKVVSGLNILTNNQVNLISSTVTAFLVAWLA